MCHPVAGVDKQGRFVSQLNARPGRPREASWSDAVRFPSFFRERHIDVLKAPGLYRDRLTIRTYVLDSLW